MSVNIWATVGGVNTFLPLTTLLGSAGQLLGMNAGATEAEWKAVTFLSSQLAVPAASGADAPAYTFTGDLDTGMRQIAGNRIGWSTGGSHRLELNDTTLLSDVAMQLVSKLLKVDKGADITAAATTDLGAATGNFLTVTNVAGNITITSLGGDTLPSGTEIETLFSITGGSVAITHNATSLIILGGANLSVLHGDIVRWRKINDASAHWQMVSFQRGLTTSLITTKGGFIVGKLSGGIIIPSEQLVGVDGSVPVAKSSEDDGIIWDTPYRRKNAVINGELNVWQSGVSFVSIADLTYFADQWIYSKNGTGVHDVSRSTDVPTVGAAGRLFNYSILLDCTTADAALAASDFYGFGQHIEGFNWAALAQRECVLSFWVKATKTGVYCVSLDNSVGDRSITLEYTINVSDTWEKKTLVIPASPSAGTWDYTNGIGVGITWTLAAGTNVQTGTIGAWQVGDFFTTANAVNGVDNTNNNFRITGVQLEAGSVATEFEDRTIEAETALCLRYFELLGVGGAWGMVPNSPNTSRMFIYHFKVRKRVSPTFTLLNTTPTFVNFSAGGNNVGAGCTLGGTGNGSSEDGIVAEITGFAAGTAGHTGTWSTAGILQASARLF